METAIQTKPTRVAKERPILFSAPMVQAILEGRKSQTRRIVKSRYESGMFQVCTANHNPNRFGYYHNRCIQAIDWNERTIDDGDILCPYGEVGDRLWVREAWQYSDDLEQPYWYRQKELVELKPEFFEVMKWKPSIHMPRAASRILLEVTDIRIERLQEITEEEAKAEGVLSFEVGDTIFYYDYGTKRYIHLNARSSFFTLWMEINGHESYASNPWVWTVDFKVLEVKGG